MLKQTTKRPAGTSTTRTPSGPRFNMPFELGLFLGCQRFGGSAIQEQFQEFQRDLPQIATHLRLSLEELTFLDYRYLISVWQQQRDPSRTLTRL